MKIKILVGRNVPRKPRLAGGVKSIRPDHGGHNMNEISLARIRLATACPGSPALWAGTFIQGPLDEFIGYKFHANNAPLQELSQFTHISIEIHKELL